MRNERLYKIFENFLKKEIDYDNPKNLYEPVKYLLDSGGKRLRPLITLFVSDLFTGNITNALSASAALEIFTILLLLMMI
jgi:geranylgeranyl diphosphate synthase type II